MLNSLENGEMCGSYEGRKISLEENQVYVPILIIQEVNMFMDLQMFSLKKKIMELVVHHLMMRIL